MARRRKISRKIPPLRQVVSDKTSPLKQVDPFNAGINNYDQANIDQNQALTFNQQFGAGTYHSSSGKGGKYDQAALNAAGINQNWGANNANTSQNKITGATTMNNSSFQATTIPNQPIDSELSLFSPIGPEGLVGRDGTSLVNRVGGGESIKGGSPNTFSSEIDPTDKTEFQNEVVNNILKSDPVADLSKPVEPTTPQNKFEELYKPS